mgnify:CR=1 FL=1
MSETSGFFRFCGFGLMVGLAAWAPAQGKLSGVLFGDFYSVGSHNTGKPNGREGWFNRRFNLSYDRKLDSAWSMRLRVEFADPGNAGHGDNVFSSEHSVDTYFKDAWLRYTVNGHKFTFGLIPTPTYEANEDRLNYRPIEKTPTDLWRMASSRDKGVSVAGPLDSQKKFDYTLMVGDGSGTRSSKSGLHTVYGRLGYKVTPQVYLSLYGDSWKRDRGARWQTGMAELFYTTPSVKLGLSLANQRRTQPGRPVSNIDVISLYGEAKLSERLSPYARLDVVGDALSDADRIAYYRMSKDGRPTFVQAGLRYRVHDNLEVVPNVTFVSYRRGPTGITPSQDVIFRLTFSLKF